MPIPNAMNRYQIATVSNNWLENSSFAVFIRDFVSFDFIDFLFVRLLNGRAIQFDPGLISQKSSKNSIGACLCVHVRSNAHTDLRIHKNW